MPSANAGNGGYGPSGMNMPQNVVQFSRGEDHAEAKDQRQRQLFAWADRVLYEAGLIERTARARPCGRI